ncbi:ABC transporter permease [Halocatena halophila]|uniref:ABC transporter permease n=1 Tax=Halocatena halophila TaxID=2814576 RepID=UPI002ED07A41
MMSVARVTAEADSAYRSFVRRRTAVFFTFFFPVIIILIFGALVQTQPTGGGLFAEAPAYYVPGYLAVVVLFTPLSRVGSTVARHRDGNRFEKLATTPLTRVEWLLAHTLVNIAIIGVASCIILGLVVVTTGATIVFSWWLVPFILFGVALFCGLGALLGRIADSQDGVIAASNSIALPLLFLSETFITPALLPEWFRPALNLSPLTYFARGVRSATMPPGGDPTGACLVVTLLAVVFVIAGAYALPKTD